MTDKHLKKRDLPSEPDDPFDAFRSLHIKKDTRTNEEKVKDSVAEAGHETRSVNQVVKLVNMSLSEKVKRLEKLKQDSQRFDEELNMFTSKNEKPEPSQPTQHNQNTLSAQPSDEPDPNEISNELLTLINKYGIDKISIAMSGVLSEIKASTNKI